MRLLKQFFLVFIALLAMVSCTDTLDFNQVDDFEATPKFTSSLVHFTLKESDFLDVVTFNEISVINDITNFEYLKSDNVKDNLVRADFLFKIKNEFQRGFVIDVEFLNDASATVYKFQTATIGAGDVNFEQTQTILINRNSGFLTATKLKITIQIQGGPQLDVNSTREFNFQSSGTFSMKF